MQRRYRQLVNSHLQASQAVASGIHAIGQASTSLAFTKGAYRFLNNPRVSLGALALPLLEAARQAAGEACDRYALVVHDWSQLMYDEQAHKKDRVALSSRRVPEGYELQTALLVSDRDGSPLAPLALSLRGGRSALLAIILGPPCRIAAGRTAAHHDRSRAAGPGTAAGACH